MRHFQAGAGDAAGPNDFYEQAKALNQGPVAQRLRFVSVAGEMVGPAEALRLLQELDDALNNQETTERPEQAQVRDIDRACMRTTPQAISTRRPSSRTNALFWTRNSAGSGGSL